MGSLTVLLHEPVKIVAGPSYDYVLVIDKSGSMAGNRDVKCREATNKLLNDLPDDTKVSVIVFNDSILDSTELLPLTESHRSRISRAVSISPTWGTDFNNALNKAREIVSNASALTRPVRIILISDGEDIWSGSRSFIEWAQKMSPPVELCAVQIEMFTSAEVREAINATGGTIQDQTTADQLASSLQKVIVSGGEAKDVDILKATYNGEADQSEDQPNIPYKIMSAVLLLLLGLLAGFSMMIMFSSRGQFRSQVILSTLMGGVAFLLLNYGKSIGLAPAWVCEAIAFSLFGLVFMARNLSVSGSSGQIPAPASGSPSGGSDEW